jgi:phosphoglycerate dehydrogenase-like enzyme
MGNQLNHKVLGIIGLGRIGMAVAKMAKGVEMKILGYDPIASRPTPRRRRGSTQDLNKIRCSRLHHRSRSQDGTDAQ